MFYNLEIYLLHTAMKKYFLLAILFSSTGFAAPKVGTEARYLWCNQWFGYASLGMQFREMDMPPREAFNKANQVMSNPVDNYGKPIKDFKWRLTEKERKDTINSVFFGQLRFYQNSTFGTQYLEMCIHPKGEFKPLK